MIRMIFVFLLAWSLVAAGWTVFQMMTRKERLRASIVALKSVIAATAAATILFVFVQLF